MTKLPAMTLSIALCGLSFAHAQPAGERTTLSGVFTAEQAKNGERVFQSRCAACHGSDLHATDPEVPDLTDDGFKYGWVGKTVANRFRNIRTAMPAGAPGGLMIRPISISLRIFFSSTECRPAIRSSCPIS